MEQAVMGGLQVLQQGGNMLFQQQQNKLNRNFAEGQARLQRQYANEDFDKTNAYNSPKEQKARMIAAGLNPNMMYGGGGNVVTAQGVRASPPADYKGIAPQSNINFQSLMQLPLMMEQTRQLKLINEAKAIDVRHLREASGLADGPDDAYDYVDEQGRRQVYVPAQHLDNNPYKLKAESIQADITAKNFTNYINSQTTEEQKNMIINKALISDINTQIAQETEQTKIDMLKKALQNASNQEKLSAAQVKLQDMEIGMQSQYYIGTLIKILSMMK